MNKLTLRAPWIYHRTVQIQTDLSFVIPIYFSVFQLKNNLDVVDMGTVFDYDNVLF